MSASRVRPLRLVLDTNVVVAGLLWNGAPRQLIEHSTSGSAVELFSSPVLLEELRHTLEYTKFAKRIETFGTTASLLANQYAALVTLVTPATVPRVVMGDADDDQVIAAAMAAGAKIIATGDKKHLLPLGSYQGINIVSAAEALKILQII